MIDIRPVTDLRYKYPEIENRVKDGYPVFLTKNGYGSMVVLSIEAFSKLTDGTERALDYADEQAALTSRRLSHEEVFSEIRRRING